MIEPTSGFRPRAAKPEELPAGPRLAVREAWKSYGATPALRGVSFNLEAGEWVGLIGPNGAGKTTLMRSLVGLVSLDAGEILIAGAPLTHRRAARLRGLIGLVPQEIALYPALTARENLEFFGRLYGARQAELSERVAWALDWTGLGPRAGEPVYRFSVGMQRRLNIACGVLHRPAVVLLDEPTVGVDPQGRQRIWAMLESLTEEGAALLQSSHQLDEIQNACHRMLILHHGQIIAGGKLAELAAGTAVGDRRVRVALERAPRGPLDLGSTPGNELRLEGRVLSGILGDVGEDLPPLLEAIHRTGLGVESLEVSSPRLEDVFIRLTGKELHE